MSVNKIAGNALWSLAGQIMPIIVAIATVPLLIRTMGMDRFGFLSLAWILVGYAGLFDLGIGRAMTRLVAAQLGNQNQEAARHIANVGTAILSIIGLVTGIGLWLGADFLVSHWLKISPDLQDEATSGLRMLALSLPLVLLTAAYRGILEAWQAFKPLNKIRILMGLLTYLAPLAAATMQPNLQWILGSVTLMRLLTTLQHAYACKRHCHTVRLFTTCDQATLGELLKIGGWMSVSNIISPLMSYLDRFVLGGLVAVGAIAYYSTPYDMITKTLVFPYSVMAVVFPILAGKSGERKESSVIFGTTIRVMFIIVFPIIFTSSVLAEPLLTLWLGNGFSTNASLILQILSIGVFANTLAQPPANLIQSQGNPKWMSILHLGELPLYIFALIAATKNYGVQGTAICWTSRMIIDCIAVYGISSKNLPRPNIPGTFYGAAIFCLLLLAPGYSINSAQGSFIYWVTGLIVYCVTTWTFLISKNDKNNLLNYLRFSRSGNR